MTKNLFALVRPVTDPPIATNPNVGKSPSPLKEIVEYSAEHNGLFRSKIFLKLYSSLKIIEVREAYIMSVIPLEYELYIFALMGNFPAMKVNRNLIKVVFPTPGGQDNERNFFFGSSMKSCIFEAMWNFPSNILRLGSQNLAEGTLSHSIATMKSSKLSFPVRK